MFNRTKDLCLSIIKQIELKASQYPDVISLAQGIPSFDTPGCIKRRVERALKRGVVSKYSLSPGLPELRELCRKLQITIKTRLTDYELHCAFVAVAGRQSHATRRLNKFLDQKYRNAIRRFTRASSDAERGVLWDAAVESGDLAGAFWALMTLPDISDPLYERVYGEVHMLSHLAGATVRLDMQELQRLQRDNGKLRAHVAEGEARARTRLAERDAELAKLRKRLKQAESLASEARELRVRLTELEREPLALRLQQQVEECQAAYSEEQAKAERAEARAREWKRMAMENGDRHLRLEEQLSELQTERQALEATLDRLLSPDCEGCPDQDNCDADVNLNGRAILYVGGRERLCAHFRLLVERQNGRFIHHDGGKHDGRLRLGSILPQADAVVCPLDCVSHDAANRVKQFCKRHDKQLVFLPRSSLAAFTRGLIELAA